MFFKKKKIAIKRKKTIKQYRILLGVLIGIFFLGTMTLQAVNIFNFKVFEYENFSQITPMNSLLDFGGEGSDDKEQEENTITYILLTGKGGGNHDAPNLTDTIILAGFNKKEESIILFSIPRDLYVEYSTSHKKGKINGVYEYYLGKGEEFAMKKLKEKISQITGKNIDFYMNIDFNGFIKIVDLLGGVKVSLEENFVDYKYPDGKLGYKTFILRKGTWILDGEVALMYARSRHSTSDFSRSLRQQNIISSLREKISQLGYFRDSKKIFNLYNIFSDYTSTDMQVSDMISLGLEIKSWKSPLSLSFNLNDSCYDGSPNCEMGGFLYVPLREYFGGASVLLPEGADVNNLSEYSIIHNYSNMLYDTPKIYSQKRDIVVFNASKTPLLAGDLANSLRPYGFSISKDHGVQNLKGENFQKSFLYYNNIKNNDPTLIALKNILNIESIYVDTPVYSSEGTQIEIILSDSLSF